MNLEYKKKIKDYPQVYLCGRLAEYRYYNMDVVILRAFEIAKEIIDELNR